MCRSLISAGRLGFCIYTYALKWKKEDSGSLSDTLLSVLLLVLHRFVYNGCETVQGDFFTRGAGLGWNDFSRFVSHPRRRQALILLLCSVAQP